MKICATRKCNTSSNRQHVLMRNMQQVLLQRRLSSSLRWSPHASSEAAYRVSNAAVNRDNFRTSAPPSAPQLLPAARRWLHTFGMVVGDRSWSTSSPPRKNSSNHAYSRRSTCSSSEVIHPRTPRMPRSHTSPGVQSIPGATTIRPPLGTTAGSS